MTLFRDGIAIDFWATKQPEPKPFLPLEVRLYETVRRRSPWRDKVAREREWSGNVGRHDSWYECTFIDGSGLYFWSTPSAMRMSHSPDGLAAILVAEMDYEVDMENAARSRAERRSPVA